MPKGYYPHNQSGWHFSEEWKIEKSERMIKFWAEHPEVRARCGRLGILCSEETKRKLSVANLGKIRSEKTKEKLRQSALKRCSRPVIGEPKPFQKGYKMTAKHKAALRAGLSKANRFGEANGMFNRERSKAERQRISEATKLGMAKLDWQNWLSKVAKAVSSKPNQLEHRLLKLLETHFPNEWRYVGDFQLIIGGMCPDFANVNGRKQLIEVFGDYWHSEDNPQDRIDRFRQFGFDCLVLWEHEIKNTSEKDLVMRIAKFMSEKGVV